MSTIRASFPKAIPIDTVKNILIGNLEENSNYTCEVEFEKMEKGENVFLISSETSEAFYLIGMTASGLMQYLEIK